MPTEALTDIYTQFAIAVSYAQAVEQNLLTILLMSEKTRKKLTAEQYNELAETWSTKTLGQVIRSINQALGPSQLDGLLMEAKERRNYLVHSFFQQNAARLLDPSCHAELMSELESAGTLLDATQRELHSVIERALLASAWTREEYDEQRRKIEAGLVAAARAKKPTQ